MFSNNVIYVYFLSCIVILGYDKFIKNQKIALIYATTIAMEILSTYSFGFMLGLLLICMFMLEEYLCDDYVKQELLSRLLPHKLLDFLYEFIFLDGGPFIIVNMIFASKGVKQLMVSDWGRTKVFYVLNIALLFLAIHMLFSSRFAIKSFSEMKQYFDELVQMNLHTNKRAVQEKFDIMTELEDRSYFARANSYNWISKEFIEYRFQRFREQKREREKRDIDWKKVLKKLKAMGIKRVVSWVKDKIRCKITDMQLECRKIRSKIRGCSTLEMQLIRQIGIRKGYEECVIRRKIFELVYSFLFFSGLKKHYKEICCAKYNCFKEFLLYVYLYSVRVTVKTEDNAEVFDPISSAFVEKQSEMESCSIEEWDVDKFYVLLLGLPNAKVGLKRLLLYPQTIIEHGICLENAYTWLQFIREDRYTPSLTNSDAVFQEKREMIFSQKVKPFYQIGNHFLPYMCDGILYGPENGPSYGEDNCWQFAQAVYGFLEMGQGWFSSEAGTEADYLRGMKRLQDRTITAEHAERFLSCVPKGSVIRIADDIKGNDSNGNRRHSQILVETDADGVVIYESNNENTGFHYYTWKAYEEMFCEYKYFKYIK